MPILRLQGRSRGQIACKLRVKRPEQERGELQPHVQLDPSAPAYMECIVEDRQFDKLRLLSANLRGLNWHRLLICVEGVDN